MHENIVWVVATLICRWFRWSPLEIPAHGPQMAGPMLSRFCQLAQQGSSARDAANLGESSSWHRGIISPDTADDWIKGYSLRLLILSLSWPEISTTSKSTFRKEDSFFSKKGGGADASFCQVITSNYATVNPLAAPSMRAEARSA